MGFPINKIEVNRRRSDYRRCLIRTPAELKLFQENTNPNDWTEDSAYALAGIPVALSDLVAKHHSKLHRALDEELHNPTLAADENAASDADADAEPESMP